MPSLDLSGAQTAGPGGIRVVIPDLKPFLRELNAVDEGKFRKEVGQAFKEIAEMAVSAASSRAQSIGSVEAHTIHVGGLRASASASDVRILLGGAKAPFAMGAEFGGGAGLNTSLRSREALSKAGRRRIRARKKRGTSTSQFPPHLGRTGYFLYPTLRDKIDEAMKRYEQVIDDLTKRAFPE